MVHVKGKQTSRGLQESVPTTMDPTFFENQG